MGCDIHIITQIKKDGSWQYVPEVPERYDRRCYPVFAFLAQVRGYCENGFERRGLPNDLESMKFGEYTEDDGSIHYMVDFNERYLHSHSYLTLQEIDEKLKENAPAEEAVHVPKRFLDAFFNHGGELPYGMDIIKEDDTGSDIIWDSGVEDYPILCSGRDDLAKIAEKYDVAPDHIRIVFAFDS